MIALVVILLAMAQPPSITISPPLTLTVRGVPGQRYTLEKSEDLVQWYAILNVGDGDTIEDAPTAPAQFYRLEYSTAVNSQ